MRYSQATKIINEARKNPEVLATDQYIEAQLSRPGLMSVALQMGPNCTLSCSHCYGDFGRNCKGLPPPKLVRKLLEESVDLHFQEICLTDGEPLRRGNREVMRAIASCSRKLPVAIMSNASFANSQGNAARWMNFLRDQGMDFCEDRSMLAVSSGPTYQVHWHNYVRLNIAFMEAFPKADFGRALAYSFLGFGEFDKEHGLLSLVGKGISSVFNAKEKRVKLVQDAKSGTLGYLVPCQTPTPILLRYAFCEPEGRASSIPSFDKTRPMREFRVEGMPFQPKDWEFLTVASNGDVGFGDSQRCIRSGRVYGNLNRDSLRSLLRGIYNDPVFQAHKLGGSRFVYHLALGIDTSLQFSGRINCDVCKGIYAQPDIIGQIRTRLKQEGVIKEYKRYLGQRGLPKTNL